jgi:hypothetical protein
MPNPAPNSHPHFSSSHVVLDDMNEASLSDRWRRKWDKLRQRGRSPREGPLLTANPPFTPPSTSRPSTPSSIPPSSAPLPPTIAESIPATAAEQSDSLTSLWSEAFQKANNETQKWIREHKLDLSEQAKPGNHIKEIIHLIESNTIFTENDSPLKIEIGYQKIVFREYIAGVVAFLTMAGDVAINFAPPQASAPWAVVKAVLKVSTCS